MSYLTVLFVILLLSTNAAGQAEEYLQCASATAGVESSKAVLEPLYMLNPADAIDILATGKYVFDDNLDNAVRRFTRTNNKFLSNEDLIYYNYYAAAADCLLAQTKNLNGSSVDINACCPCQLFMNDLQCYQPILHGFTKEMTLLTVSEKRGEIVVSFGGTRSPGKSANAIKTMSLTNQEDLKHIKVVQGFYEASEAVYVKTIAALKDGLKKYNLSRVVFTGHGFGGAVAAVMVARLKINNTLLGAEVKNYSLVTYGMPRIGNSGFADMMNNLKMQVTRVTANNDLIPHLPPVSWMSPDDGYFVHFHPEVWINGSTTKRCSTYAYEDKMCSNSRGPAYVPSDHLFYWNITYGACVDMRTTAFLEMENFGKVTDCELVVPTDED